jgi:hypothetical protein
LELKWLANQQYKYGMGTAEAFVKYPQIEGLDRFAELKENMDLRKKGIAKNAVKKLLATSTGRKTILIWAQLFEVILPKRNHMFLFGLLTTANFRAGYLRGLLKFTKGE